MSFSSSRSGSPGDPGDFNRNLRRQARTNVAKFREQGRTLASGSASPEQLSAPDARSLTPNEREDLFQAEARIKARRQALLERQGRPGRAQTIITERPRTV